MRLQREKRIAHSIGLYRPMRALNLHLFRREALRSQRVAQEFYAEFLRSGDLVFDVGANWGDMSQLYLRLGARVVAFEPIPDCKWELDARVGPHKHFTTVASALGARVGELPIHVNRHRGASSLVSSWSPESNIEEKFMVPITTLDLMIERYGHPAYIKIDVEGFEAEVLRGLSSPVSLLSFEFTRDHETGTEAVRDCLEQLAQMGDISINITRAETPGFCLKRWLSKDEFLVSYPTDYGHFDFRYGDIFVRTAAVAGQPDVDSRPA